MTEQNTLSDSERSLIESGVLTYAEVMSGRAELAMAWYDAARELAAARAYDETHCPVCGADLDAEPEHCR